MSMRIVPGLLNLNTNWAWAKQKQTFLYLGQPVFVIQCQAHSLYMISCCCCCCFIYRVSLCVPSCPGPHFVDPADLELTEIYLFLSACQVLGVCTWTIFLFFPLYYKRLFLYYFSSLVIFYQIYVLYNITCIFFIIFSYIYLLRCGICGSEVNLQEFRHVGLSSKLGPQIWRKAPSSAESSCHSDLHL